MSRNEREEVEGEDDDGEMKMGSTRLGKETGCVSGVLYILK